MGSPEVTLLDTCALLGTVNGDPFSAEALSNQQSKEFRRTLSVSGNRVGDRDSRSTRQGRVGRRCGKLCNPRLHASGDSNRAVNPDIAVRASYLPGQFHSDPADRLLISTAIVMGLKLVTRDREILRYASRGYVSALRC